MIYKAPKSQKESGRIVAEETVELRTFPESCRGLFVGRHGESRRIGIWALLIYMLARVMRSWSYICDQVNSIVTDCPVAINSRSAQRGALAVTSLY